MATLGTMRTRIADELQISSSVLSTEIDRAIYSAIAYYNDMDFWFLEATNVLFTLSSTVQYPLTTILPGRSQIKAISLHVNNAKPELWYRTMDEIREFDYNTSYTGEPMMWSIYNDNLQIQPRPNRTYTAEVWYTLQRSLTASASASNVWTTEAEELIRLHAEVDLLENRIKDYDAALRIRPRVMITLHNLHTKTVQRRGLRRIKPFL